MKHLNVMTQRPVEPDEFAPERSPFTTVIVDITHRCNMKCANCYVPNRTIPDLDCNWVLSVLTRLPHKVQVRLVGGEPTLSDDLPRYIAGIRRLGHEPVLLTNGLKLADRDYLHTLQVAGLRMVYLSFNGGFDEAAYETIDGQRCAAKKLRAFANISRARMFTILGTIVVRGINEGQIGPIVEFARMHRCVRELHFRSIGAMGRYMDQSRPYSRDELLEQFYAATQTCPADLRRQAQDGCGATHVQYGRMQIQFTQWPDLGSLTRGRLTPNGTIAPFFEHVLANNGGY